MTQTTRGFLLCSPREKSFFTAFRCALGCAATALAVLACQNPSSWSSSPTVFAGGYSLSSSNVQVAGYWQNGSWVGLPNPNASSTYGAEVTSLVVVGP